MVLLVMSAARRIKSTMKTGSLGSLGVRMTSLEWLNVSALAFVTSRPLPLETLNSGSVGTPLPTLLPLM